MSIKISKSIRMEDIIKKYPDELNNIQSEVLFREGFEYLIDKWNKLCSGNELDENTRRLIMKSCELYLKKMKTLGFINNKNIKYIFELLEKNIRGFSTNFISDYASWNGQTGDLIYNKNNNFSEDRAIRTIFHEMNHALTTRRLDGINPFVSVDKSHYERKKIRTGIAQESNLKIPGLHIAGILGEYLAEEMAHQLWYEEDSKRPAKTITTSFGINFGEPIYSNLDAEYNRAYQQIIEDFLKNIKGINTKDNDTNEKRARALFNFCLRDGNDDIIVDLFNQYNSSNNEHKRKIFRTLGNISSRICYKNGIIPAAYCYTDSDIFNLLHRDCIQLEHGRVQLTRSNEQEER